LQLVLSEEQISSENATTGGGVRFDPLLGWRGCRKSLGIGALGGLRSTEIWPFEFREISTFREI